jgi:hypothetical protein
MTAFPEMPPDFVVRFVKMQYQQKKRENSREHPPQERVFPARKSQFESHRGRKAEQ